MLKRLWLNLIVLALFVSISITGCSSEEQSSVSGVIVKDGVSNAVIVVPEKVLRTTALAVTELQTYIKKISGAEIEVVSKPVDDGRVNIYVGKSKFTDDLGIKVDDLDYGAYHIKAGDGYLVLVGFDSEFVPKQPYAKNNGDIARMNKEWDKLSGGMWVNPTAGSYKWFNRGFNISQGDRFGSLNAVYGFLRSLGVRWYMPGELGEIVPEKKTIEVAAVNKIVRPEFILRNMHFAPHHMRAQDHIIWYLRLGLNRDGAVFGCGALSHGGRNVLGRDEMRKAHPEYYALYKGIRNSEKDAFGGHSGKPCLSSKGLLAENLKYAQAVFKIYDTPMISVMPQDGFGVVCQCDLCKPKETPERGWYGGMSDYVWEYVDKFAKELYKTNPDKLVSCFAYGTYFLPPKKIKKFSPNVVVGIVQNRGQMTNPEKKKWFDEIRAEWLKKVSTKLVIWDHYLYSRESSIYNGLPVYYPKTIAEDIKALKGKSYGDFIEVTFAQKLAMHAPILNHLNVYVTARLYWDPDRDINDLLDEYYKDFYGPVAEKMKAFVDYSEYNWLNMKDDPEALAKAINLFNDVKSAVDKDSVYGKRIALLDDYLKIDELRDRLVNGRKDAKSIRCLGMNEDNFKLDGKFDDTLWQRSMWSRLYETQTGNEAFYQTEFKFSWTDDTLYLAVKCFDNDMKNLNITTTENENNAIWGGDCVEFLLETQVNSYYQITVNPAGAVMDLNRKGGFESKWSSNAQVAVVREKDYWAVEMALPIADEGQSEMDPFNGVPGRRPTDTFPFYFNVCRQRLRGNSREFSAFSPTGKPNFHVPLKFAKFYVK